MGMRIGGSSHKPHTPPTAAQKAAWEQRKQALTNDVASAGPNGISEAALENKLGIKAGSPQATKFDQFFKAAAQGGPNLTSADLSAFEAAHGGRMKPQTA